MPISDTDYRAAVDEFRQIKHQFDDLLNNLEQKRQQVNQLAGLIGKPPLEPHRPTLSLQPTVPCAHTPFAQAFLKTGTR